MKRLKPGFKVFIKTRLRHPLKGSLELLFTGEDGIKYTDYGSTHTAMLTALYLLLWIPVIFHVRFTALGWAAWLLIPVLHRFILRYFWTKFEVYEGEHAPVRAEVLLKRKESRKRTGALKKVVVVLEAVLVVAAVVGAFIATQHPPFAVGKYDQPPQITAELETAQQLYDYAHKYVQEQCPGAQLIAYRLSAGEDVERQKGESKADVIWCNMFFRSPNQGVFIRNPKGLIWVFLNTESEYMMSDFFYSSGKYSSAEAIEFIPVPGDYPKGFYD